MKRAGSAPTSHESALSMRSTKVTVQFMHYDFDILIIFPGGKMA